MLTVRLDEETRQKLDALVRLSGRARSDIVREAIQAYSLLAVEEEEKSVYDRLSGAIGVVEIGGDRARQSERLLRDGFGRKRSR